MKRVFGHFPRSKFVAAQINVQQTMTPFRMVRIDSNARSGSHGQRPIVMSQFKWYKFQFGWPTL